MAPRIIYRPSPGWNDPVTDDDERDSTSRFKSGQSSERYTPLYKTELLLRTEAEAIGASEVIVELDAPAKDFRADESGLRADRRAPEFPGVVVRLIGTRFGDLRYACDQFTNRWAGEMPGWEGNLRAVALGLESLRRVERYGIARRGEQYAGWAALGAGTPMGTGAPEVQMTLDEAARFLSAAVEGLDWTDVLEEPGDAKTAYRLASKRLHPDNLHTGSHDAFLRLEKAWQLVQAHHGAGSPAAVR